jgi:hypothetical protein
LTSLSLREFQVEALRRIAAGNLYLAAKPGAGKTAVAVHAAYNELYDAFSCTRVVVVTPKRVVPQFAADAAKWGLPLTFSECLGPEPARLAAVQRPSDVLVTTPEFFPWLVKTFKAWPFGLVVYDEASRLRNGGRQGSVSWKAMNVVRRKGIKILLMSGSPRPGSSHELFAPVFLLDGGERLGTTLSAFRERFLAPDKVDRRSGRVFSWKTREGMQEALYGAVQDLYYAASPDLGVRYTEIDRWVDLPDNVQVQEQRMLRELVADFDWAELTASSAGVAAGKLKQLSSGEVFVDEETTAVVHDEKMQALAEVVEEHEGEPLLVAYWYTHELARLQRAYPEAVDITTDEGLAAAKAGKVKLALIHPQSAGHGIDGLQHAFSSLVFYTLPDSYEYYDQLIKRIVRVGQKETVRVFRILAGVADVRVREGLIRKQEEQEGFYNFLAG